MKMPKNDGKYPTCPPTKGRAVCVDVTPLKRYETAFGPKDKFKVVFEVDLLREDGTPYVVWSKPFTPSSHERSAFATFIKDWFGRMPTKEEWAKFDTEDLIGRPAEIVVIHEHVDGETYANIKLIMPDNSGNPLKPSGKFVRAKDRPPKETNGGGYRRAEQPADDSGDLGATKIHVGRCKGLEVRDRRARTSAEGDPKARENLSVEALITLRRSAARQNELREKRIRLCDRGFRWISSRGRAYRRP